MTPDFFKRRRVGRRLVGDGELGIAQAIMEGHEIMLLDEPFNVLDF